MNTFGVEFFRISQSEVKSIAAFAQLKEVRFNKWEKSEWYALSHVVKIFCKGELGFMTLLFLKCWLMIGRAPRLCSCRLCGCMCVSCDCRLIQRLACFYLWTMKLEGIHQSFMSSQRKVLIPPISPVMALYSSWWRWDQTGGNFLSSFITNCTCARLSSWVFMCPSMQCR